MEYSRKGKRDEEKGLSTPNPHVDGENGKKAIIYNMKKEKTKGVVNSQVIALEHIQGYFLYRYMRITLSF